VALVTSLCHVAVVVGVGASDLFAINSWALDLLLAVSSAARVAIAELGSVGVVPAVASADTSRLFANNCALRIATRVSWAAVFELGTMWVVLAVSFADTSRPFANNALRISTGVSWAAVSELGTVWVVLAVAFADTSLGFFASLGDKFADSRVASFSDGALLANEVAAVVMRLSFGKKSAIGKACHSAVGKLIAKRCKKPKRCVRKSNCKYYPHSAKLRNGCPRYPCGYPKCVVCKRPRCVRKRNCKYYPHGAKLKNGCPRYPCGYPKCTVVCKKPRCVRRSNCRYYPNGAKLSNGCPRYPCGYAKC
jgi:hypothetical protein